MASRSISACFRIPPNLPQPIGKPQIVCIRISPERFDPLIGYEVSRTGGTEAAAPGMIRLRATARRQPRPERSEWGFPISRSPMLILIALICAAYLITAQAAGMPTFTRP